MKVLLLLQWGFHDHHLQPKLNSITNGLVYFIMNLKFPHFTLYLLVVKCHRIICSKSIVDDVISCDCEGTRYDSELKSEGLKSCTFSNFLMKAS